MSTLQERLDRIKRGFLEQAPEQVKAIMTRATEDLHTSGIMSRIARPPAPLPAFELADSGGAIRRSAHLLCRGSLIVSFYRGLW